MNSFRRVIISVTLMFLILIGSGQLVLAQTNSGETLLCRFPTIHNNTIVFESSGNLWKVNRTGGTAVRLTTDNGYDLMPRFSPDGHTIAFTGQYDGNTDVYTIPVSGGDVTRLTFHSDVVQRPPTRWGPDNMVVTWSPDGKNIVFLSRRTTFNSWFGQLFTVGKDGGLPEQMPLPKGGTLTYSPDGSKIAFNRIFRNFRTWKRYKGGLAQDIWIYDFKTRKTERVTDWKGTDTYPMWYKDTIYFASDRGPNQRLNIWAYNTQTKNFRQVTHFKNYDVDWPSLGNDAIVFQDGGSLYVLDLSSEQLHKIDVKVPTDGTRSRPRWVEAQHMIRSFNLAPNGKRALFGARGDIFTVPAKHGPTRDLTQTSGAQEQYPAWSPDGKWVAYLTDSHGSNELAIRPSDGSGSEELITDTKEGYYMDPSWSPGSDKLVYHDNNHVLWYVDIKNKKPVKIDEDPLSNITDYNWSPDGKWIAYSKVNDSGISQIYFYNLAENKTTLVSNGMNSDREPVFSPDGKYLYFISKRHENPTFSETEFNIATQKMDGIYLATLQKNEPSPFAPKSDEGVPETPSKTQKGETGPWKPGDSATIKVDLDGLMNRVVPLNVEPGDYSNLLAGKDRIYYETSPLQTISGPLPNSGEFSVRYYNMSDKKGGVTIPKAYGYTLSADGSTILYSAGGGNFDLIPASAEDGNGSEHLNVSNMKVQINPREEWTEMYHQSWRLFRDFFYSKKMNGVNWDEVGKSYGKLVPLISCREDLNYLIGEMIGELCNSHTYVWGGELGYKEHYNTTGLLGVDFGLNAKSGRYYFKKIYRGDNSRDDYRSPLTEPGVSAKEGDYLLAVNGRELKAPTNPYSLFVNTVGDQVVLTLADTPDGKNKHDITVKPISNELSLRLKAWIDHNREVVNKKSDGKIGYIYMSDMEGLGMNQFIRQFYTQLNKQGLIIDDRFNGGGFIDPIVLERLRRKLIAMSTNRAEAKETEPGAVLHGYKATLINSYSASDGDIFPYKFKQYKLGPLIGTRTWGGVRGYNNVWQLIDGGNLVVSQASMYGLNSNWILENHGVEPDIRVDDMPGDVMAGKDAQLDTAIDTLMKEIKAHPMPIPKPPAALPAYPPNGR